jgi:hypothetical protein
MNISLIFKKLESEKIGKTKENRVLKMRKEGGR